MGQQPLGLQLTRFFYGIAAFAALITAIAALAPAVTGAPGGCQVVITVGVPSPLGPAGGGAPSQTGPGPSVPGLPALCVQYLDLRLPALAVILGVVLGLTTIRLGREPDSWGVSIAAGAIVGIIAALVASYAILGIFSSDQPRHSPGPGELLIAGAPVLAALASVVAVWWSYGRGRGATKQSG